MATILGDRDERGEDTLKRRRGGIGKLLRGIAKGWGAKKLGGGCISTILIFLLCGSWAISRFPLSSKAEFSSAGGSHQGRPFNLQDTVMP